MEIEDFSIGDIIAVSYSNSFTIGVYAGVSKSHNLTYIWLPSVVYDYDFSKFSKSYICSYHSTRVLKLHEYNLTASQLFNYKQILKELLK
jgi:hypothetical protein